MKRWIHIGFLLISCIIVLLPLLAFRNQDEKSERLEKRQLASPPSVARASQVVSSGVTGELETFFTDHIGFRASLVDLANSVKVKALGISSSKNVILGRDGWLFYYLPGEEIDPMADFLGQSDFSEEWMADKLAFFEELRTECERAGASFYLIIGPNKASIYGDEYLPECFLPGSAETRADLFVDYLQANSDIPVIYSKDALRAQRDRELLYYKLDTHWSELGAYVAYREWYQAYTGVLLPDIPACETHSVGDGEKDLLGMLAVTLPDAAYRSVRLPNAASYTAERTVDDAGIEWVHSVSENENGKHLLLFRDSFSEQMFPYILPAFQTVTAAWKYAVREDFSLIAEERPDVVIYEIVERNLPYVGE